MTDVPLTSSRRFTLGRRTGWILLILLVVLANALPYRKLVNIDDAYISYRYAENLLRHGQLVYNLVGDKAFAATSPGYTVVLAGLGALGMPIDFAGYAIGIIAILVAALALMDLLRKWPMHAGVGAGLLLALLPLSWLVIGMESVPVMALVLLSYTLTLRSQHGYAAALLVLATIFRFDAVAAAGAWGVWLLLTLRLKAIRPIALYGAGTLLIYAVLRVFLNVPLPTTLASKQAQVALGVTGFAPHTTYASGIGLLAQAHTAQSAAYWLAGILALVGTAGAVLFLIRKVARGRENSVDQTQPAEGSLELAPVFLLALWAIAHLIAYLILGVTPYLWYYLPFFPLVATLVALGVTLVVLGLSRIWRSAGQPHVAQGLAAVIWVAVLLGPLASHLAIRQTQPELGGGKEPVADSLLLPGGQWGPYKSMGEWLKANTPANATAGMMEIGIPGYYSQRRVVDFLGLLDTDIADALTRGDIAWALYAQQPDYLMLGKGYPMYSYNVYEDRWFQSTYAPAYLEPNRVPGGNWWVLYQRTTEPRPTGVVASIPASAEPLAIRFGDTFELVGIEAPASPWRPEDPAGLTLYWRVLKQPSLDYTLFVHLRDGRGNIIAGRDGPPMLGARPTSQWKPGELIADYQPIGLPPMPVAPTSLTFEVGFYDAATGTRLPAFGPDGKEMLGGQAQFGSRELDPTSAPIRFGAGDPGNVADLAIQSYRLTAPALKRGGSEELELVVSESTQPVTITAELWDWPGQRAIWHQEIPVPGTGVYKAPISIRQDEPANEGDLRIKVSQNGAGLSWLDQMGHAISGSAPLTPLTIGQP